MRMKIGVQRKKENGGRQVSTKKMEVIESLSNNLEKYNTLIITSISGMPSFLLQRIRRDLKDKAIVRIVKRRVLLKLFEEEVKKDERFSKLADFCSKLKDSCAIIFSDEDIFSLVKTLQEKKEKKKAKSGEARDDIVIEAGNTGLMPGPILTELSDAGIKAGLEKGKVVIKADFEIKKGQMISEALANAMGKLNILPITARLLPLVAYDKKADLLFSTEDLVIDVELQLKKLKEAYINALNLILEVKYFIKESTPLFLQEAYNQASHLAREAGIVTKDNIKDFLIEAHNQASVINKKL